MEQVHQHVSWNKQSRLRMNKKIPIIITTKVLIISEAIVIKHKMVNNRNSDDNKNEENKNSSQKPQRVGI